MIMQTDLLFGPHNNQFLLPPKHLDLNLCPFFVLVFVFDADHDFF